MILNLTEDLRAATLAGDVRAMQVATEAIAQLVGGPPSALAKSR